MPYILYIALPNDGKAGIIGATLTAIPQHAADAMTVDYIESHYQNNVAPWYSFFVAEPTNFNFESNTHAIFSLNQVAQSELIPVIQPIGLEAKTPLTTPNLSTGYYISDLITDDASFHKSKALAEIVENFGCKLLFLPPYSPDFNPIEHTWATLKLLIKNIRRSVHNLADAISIALNS